MMRRLFGLPGREVPPPVSPGPTHLRIGTGDMLSWAGQFARVEAVVAVGDGPVDVCLVSDGADELVVVFDEDRGLLWRTEMQTSRPWAVATDAVWSGQHVRVRRDGSCVAVEFRNGFHVADLTTTGFTCDWINAYGRPSQRQPGLALGPYITEE